ncbi:MAG: cytochrome c3 family protein [Nitrospirae bacterium]|nr:cytochrome c3 family protein [Nitrospirota bacterium]
MQTKRFRTIRVISITALCLLLLPVGLPERATAANILSTKHNLSVSGPGTIKAATETRICVFCHTPHNHDPNKRNTPLWNRDITAQTYTLQPQGTMKHTPGQPTGTTRLCLTCHDGTLAIGTVLNPSVGITMQGGGISGFSNFGIDLSGHHPVSFSYSSALPNAELASPQPANLLFGNGDEVHCTTCHDPHDNTNGQFLVMDNRSSALCITCHVINGWSSSGHATSAAVVPGIPPVLPTGGKNAPNWTSIGEWGCEICHTPHFAPGVSGLLNYTDPSTYCVTCHSPVPAPPPPPLHGEAVRSSGPARSSSAALYQMADIRSQVRKASGHHEQPGIPHAALHNRRGSSRDMIRHVTCADCHNPHVSTRDRATAPYASGMLKGVSGMDRNGMVVRAATYEYEVCFKCHGDHTTDFPVIPRVVVNTNKRQQFDSVNPSYHPVVSMGRSINVPSIPSPLEPSLRASNMIYCTDCHSDDAGGSKGPHGSSYAPILRERYETSDNTPESYENYALCYRCHNRTSILNDQSFQRKAAKTTATGGGHSGHLAKGIPCSACHDAHGVSIKGTPASSGTGDHTNLINFDARIVAPKPGSKVPFFTQTGMFAGNCTLSCHGRMHSNEAYP